MSESKCLPRVLKTTVVGSYPQPDWLVDKSLLRGQRVPRVSAEQIWRIDPERRDEALRDATAVVIREMELADIDVITDGEICRESYTNHFSTSLAGMEASQPAVILNRAGREVRVPRVVGPIRHRSPVELEWATFLRRQTKRTAKVTLPGPFTLAQQVKDEYYGDESELALEFARALNIEARLLEGAGVDVVQFDEPWLRNNPQAARRFGVKALDRALHGLSCRTAVHVCFGYAFLRPEHKPNAYEYLAELADSAVHEISIEAAQPNLDLGVLNDLSPKDVALGVLDHSTSEAESVAVVGARIRGALNHVPPERLMPAPDCGMKYMDRQVAFRRLQNLATAAARIRYELTGAALNRVTLTFDNGPNPGVTGHVLDVLKDFGVRATFFLVGTRLAAVGARTLAERAADESHWIGNHSMTHGAPLGMRATDTAEQEICAMDALLGDLIHPDRLFRPNGRGTVGPHLLSDCARDLLIRNRNTVVLWTYVPPDRQGPADAWVAHAQRESQQNDWSLFVLHDRHSGHDQPAGSMAFLPAYLDWARKSNIQFVQEFPPGCVPIRRGKICMPLDRFVTAASGAGQ